MGDEIKLPASEAVGEIREGLRAALVAERLQLVRSVRSYVTAGGSLPFAIEGEAFDAAIDSIARNIAVRLLGRGWGT